MTEREAGELVRAVEHLWRFEMDSGARAIWIQSIQQMESTHVSEAVLRLSERQRERPTLADIRNMIRHIVANHAARDVRPALPRGTEEIPTWVQVWAWARWAKGDQRAFPQQSDHVISDMTPGEYDVLEAEWRESGSPSVTVDNLVRVMSGI